MKKLQAGNLIGYVDFELHRRDVVSFIRQCRQQHIYVWDIRETESDYVAGKLYWHQCRRAVELASGLDMDVHRSAAKGLFPDMLRFFRRRDTIAAAIISILCIFFLSNLIWNIEIKGVSRELEMEIRRELDNHGLSDGGWAFQAASLDDIQQALLHDIPELLYIGIEKKGTAYQIDAVEKLQEKKDTANPSSSLVANKTGVIEKMLLKSGVAKKQVHDFVKKGDVLVTGMVELEEDGGDSDKEAKTKMVGAEGKVYATTWYKTVVTMPVQTGKELLTGTYTTRHHLVIGDFRMPIRGFSNIPFVGYTAEEKDVTPKLFQWELPFRIKRTTYYETYKVSTDYTENKAREKAIEQVLGDVAAKLGNDAEIRNYNVLHESTDNGKVKLNLYISVMENIAEPK